MFRWIIALSVCAACLSAQAQKKSESGGIGYSVGKVPVWVQPPPAGASASSDGRSAYRYLLADSQVNLTGVAPVRFARAQIAVSDPAALSQVAQIHIEFNPGYESLTIHEVGVTRAGQRINKLPATKFEVLQRETRLERSVYDGMVTAFAVIDDVRVNDVVDYSYSVRGANPIFEDKHASQYVLNANIPTDVRRVRIEYPSRRSLRYKVFGITQEPRLTSREGKSVIELVLTGQRPLAVEDRLPAWAIAYPEMQVSEYADWSEVEAWARKHYSVSAALPRELAQLVDEIRQGSKSAEEMASRALRFVQDEVRYFAVTTGTSSHKPSPPDVTYARRYGDCKDKAVLTLALLHALGIEAHPALVSYFRQRQVAEWLPSPNAFDHVITQATINGRTFWLDATRSYQGEDLSRLGFHSFGRALVVGAGRAELTDVVSPADYEDALRVTERFSMKTFSSPVTLTVVSRSSGAQAERIRGYVASKDLETFANELTDDLKRRYRGLRRTRLPEFADDRALNEFTVTEHYEDPELFSYAWGRVSTNILANAMLRTLQAPDRVTRSSPLYLPFPVRVVHRFEFQLPVELPPGAGQPVVVSAPQFAFSYVPQNRGRDMSFQFELQFLRDHVTPEEMPAYLEAIAKARMQLQRTLRLPVFNPLRLEADQAAALKAQEPQLVRKPEWMRRHIRESLLNRMAVEGAIASGQLDGKFLAHAWLEIAVERNQAGDGDKALEAVELALKAQPDFPRAYKTRAEILAYTGKFAAALEAIKRATPVMDEVGTAFSLGQILYFLGRYGDALESLTQDARRVAGVERIFRLLWINLAAKRAGVDPLQAMRRSGYDGTVTQWPGPIAAYLLGEMPEEKLLDAARADQRDAAPRLCEAWFFIGQLRLIAGEGERARAAFQESVSTQIEPYMEYKYSQLELARTQ